MAANMKVCLLYQISQDQQFYMSTNTVSDLRVESTISWNTGIWICVNAQVGHSLDPRLFQLGKEVKSLAWTILSTGILLSVLMKEKNTTTANQYSSSTHILYTAKTERLI